MDPIQTEFVRRWAFGPNQNQISTFPGERLHNPNRYAVNQLRWHEIAHKVRKAFQAAGLAVPGKPVGLHSLRHSYCTNLVRSGADIEQVRALAGHSSIVVSQRYLWSDTESRRAAARSMFEMVESGASGLLP